MDVVKIEKNGKKVRIRLKHRLFMDYYFNPAHKDTFGNTYQAAKRAGFKDSYARMLPSLKPQWYTDLLAEMSTFEPEHIYRGFQDVAVNAAKDSDRLKALEMMGKAKGMFIDRVQNDVRVEFINDVPRPEQERVIIDADPDKSA